MTSTYSVRPLSEADARQILAWRYAPPYDIYNLIDADPAPADLARAVAFLLDPENLYFAVDDEDDVLLGFCCFGREAQVPGYDYSSQHALDVGLSMAPARTGQGGGQAFLAAILAFGFARFQTRRVRATVAAFNQRSQRLFRRAGFVRVASFTSATATPRAFVVLTASAD